VALASSYEEPNWISSMSYWRSFLTLAADAFAGTTTVAGTRGASPHGRSQTVVSR